MSAWKDLAYAGLVVPWGRTGALEAVHKGGTSFPEGDARPSEATVAGTGKAHADASTDVAHDSGERLLPFVSEFTANCVEEGSSFASKEPIGGGDERSKVAALLEARL